MSSGMNRRGFLAAGAAGVAAPLALGGVASEPVKAAAPLPLKWQNGESPWPICLDTATIRPASLRDKIRIAAEAGYDAIEPWDGELRDFEENGGNLEDLGKEITDLGLFVPSVIGLWSSIQPTREEFEANLEATRDRLRMISAIGSQHAQVIPSREEMDAKEMADQFHDLIEIGINDYDVIPALVFVSFLPSSRRLGQAAAIAIDSGHPKAKIIPDVFHMYIADSPFNSMRRLQPDMIAIFQYNDAPADPPKEEAQDKDRVYPGDGFLPVTDFLKDLLYIGYEDCVSLELYNPTYWEQDHLEVAKTGLEKTMNTVRQAVEEYGNGD